MRLILAGGRHLDDAALIRRALSRAHSLHPLTVLIHGGTGTLGATADDWAREMRLHLVRYPANWRAFGKRAGAIRNAFMLEDSRPDMLLALPGGTDTADLVALAHNAGLPVITAQGRPVTAQAGQTPPLSDTH